MSINMTFSVSTGGAPVRFALIVCLPDATLRCGYSLLSRSIFGEHQNWRSALSSSGNSEGRVVASTLRRASGEAAHVGLGGLKSGKPYLFAGGSLGASDQSALLFL
jgi:hypothetical protein